jgi:hypothetical protein
VLCFAEGIAMDNWLGLSVGLVVAVLSFAEGLAVRANVEVLLGFVVLGFADKPMKGNWFGFSVLCFAEGLAVGD